VILALNGSVRAAGGIMGSGIAAVRARAEADVVVQGKHGIRSKDRAGFTVNASLVLFILSAIRTCESRTPDTVVVGLGTESADLGR
jgi:3-hydroxyacyl-CoA dehydrogenase